MKKFLMGIAAIVLAISFNAFTPVKHSQKPTETQYYWFSASDLSGSGYHDLKTTTDEIATGFCPNVGTTACEYAFLGSQLNTTNVPGSGVAGGQSAQAQINKN